MDDDGAIQPWDGKSIGEIQVRGAWVTGSYFGSADTSKFKDSWLCTGDVGFITPEGYVQLVDRSKDVIKSGGEWISSVAMENLLMAHPDVFEAAVIAIPDERWGERPLPCIVSRQSRTVTPAERRGWLADQFPSWALPSRWAFVEALPRTSVGKFDKKALRAIHGAGKLPII